jgi:hypothetical protein
LPTISVITAAYGPKAHYLPEAARGVQAQQLPAGWSLEWIVQEDGDHPALAESIGAVLLPHAVATLVRRFEEHPIHWAVGAADDLLEDGTRRSWDSELPFGLTPAGRVNQWAEHHGGNWPVHGGGLMMRTDTLRALGGWTGIPVDDELAALAAISELADGWNDPAVTWLYRKHRDQTSLNSHYPGLEDTGRRIALQRAKALRNTAFTLTDHAPGDNSHQVDLGPNIRLSSGTSPIPE